MNSINPIRKWMVSLRVYSLPFIILPYLFGILIAISIDGYAVNFTYVFIGLLPPFLFHFAGILQSDIYDYLNGVDTSPNRLSGGVIRKWITPRQAWSVVIGLYFISFLIIIYLMLEYGPGMLPYIITMILGIFYSLGNKFAFKYNAIGEWFLFASIGLVIPAYGFFIVTGVNSLTPVLVALPSAFFMAAIKHANNWIGALTVSPDTLEKGTFAYRAGFKVSRWYYFILITAPYVLTAAIVSWESYFTPEIPATLLITFFTFPFLLVLFSRAGKTKLIDPGNRILGLDSMTAVLYSVFMVLCCAAMII